jgi:hypothetical protein
MGHMDEVLASVLTIWGCSYISITLSRVDEAGNVWHSTHEGSKTF